MDGWFVFINPIIYFKVLEPQNLPTYVSEVDKVRQSRHSHSEIFGRITYVLYRVGPQFEDTSFSFKKFNKANRCIQFFVTIM